MLCRHRRLFTVAAGSTVLVTPGLVSLPDVTTGAELVALGAELVPCLLLLGSTVTLPAEYEGFASAFATWAPVAAAVVDGSCSAVNALLARVSVMVGPVWGLTALAAGMVPVSTIAVGVCDDWPKKKATPLTTRAADVHPAAGRHQCDAEVDTA